MIIRSIHPGHTQPNIIEVPRQTSFNIPIPGPYSASVRSASKRVRPGIGSNIPLIRFLFNVQVPNANLDYLAKLDLREDMEEGSDLWNVLYRLVGRKRLQECSGADFNLDSLTNLPCDIEVEHVVDEAGRYEFPLVVVTNLREAGSLVKAMGREVN